MDYLAIGATLVCLLAAVAVYLHRAGPFARKEVLSASPFGLPPEPEAHDPDEWMARGLGVELPTADIEAYEAAAEKLKGMKRGSPEVSEAHQLAVNLLMQRACASLLAIWKATREMERLFRMRRTNRLSDVEWAGVEEEFEAFREERLSVAEQASWLRPGWPGGWGESVFTDAHRALLRARERMLADGHEPDDERVPPAGRLRFEPGARVQCNVGRDPSGSVKWSCGTVLSSYELPYKVALDEAGRVNAPQDHDGLIRSAPDDDAGPPAGADLALWRPYRFKPGDRVAANCGSEGFLAGTVLERNILADLQPGEERGPACPPGKKLRAAYAVRLDGPQERVVLAPMDVERVVRAASPEDEAKAAAAALEAKAAAEATAKQAGSEAGGVAAGAEAGAAAGAAAGPGWDAAQAVD